MLYVRSLVARKPVLSRYKKDGKIEPDSQDVILDTWLDVGYDPFFIFKILDYFHYLLTDPRIMAIKIWISVNILYLKIV